MLKIYIVIHVEGYFLVINFLYILLLFGDFSCHFDFFLLAHVIGKEG